jgi:ABC-2 type transport system permease protein
VTAVAAGTATTAVRKVLVISSTGMRRLLRDRQQAFFVFVFPLLLILALGSVFGDALSGGERLRFGVAAPSGDALAAEVVAALGGHEVEISHFGSAGTLRRAVELGEVEAGIAIPDGYSGRLLAGGDSDIGFVARPGGRGARLRPLAEAAIAPQAVRLQAARFAAEHGTAALGEARRRAAEVEAAQPGVTVRTGTVGDELFPTTLGRFDLGASSQLVLFMFVNGLTAAAVLIQSRQLGVAHRMLATPTSTRVVLAGEMCSRLLVTLFQGVYIMLATTLLFGVDWGSVAGALAVVVAFALVPSAAAVLAGATLANDQQMTAVGVGLGLGLAALGGSMAPLEIFSPTLRTIAHLTPHAWANDAFADLVRDGGGVVDVLPDIGVLLAMAALLTVLATRRLRRTLTAA